MQLPLLPLAKAYTPLALDNLRAKEQRLSAEKRVDDALTAQMIVLFPCAAIWVSALTCPGGICGWIWGRARQPELYSDDGEPYGK